MFFVSFAFFFFLQKSISLPNSLPVLLVLCLYFCGKMVLVVTGIGIGIGTGIGGLPGAPRFDSFFALLPLGAFQQPQLLASGSTIPQGPHFAGGGSTCSPSPKSRQTSLPLAGPREGIAKRCAVWQSPPGTWLEPVSL